MQKKLFWQPTFYDKRNSKEIFQIFFRFANDAHDINLLMQMSSLRAQEAFAFQLKTDSQSLKVNIFFSPPHIFHSSTFLVKKVTGIRKLD